jgi:hypothetical protein
VDTPPLPLGSYLRQQAVSHIHPYAMDGIGDGTEGMGFDMPMLMNQQPHLFGAYGHDGSPVAPIFSNSTFHDDPSIGMADDNSDAKRRRIARVSGETSYTSNSRLPR